MTMKPMKEKPKQCRAERTAAADAHLLTLRLPSCASHPRGKRSTAVHRPDGCKHMGGPTLLDFNLLQKMSC